MMYLALLTEMPSEEHPNGVEVSAPSYRRTLAYFGDDFRGTRSNTETITFPKIPFGEDWGEVVGLAVYDEEGTCWATGPLHRPTHLFGDVDGGMVVSFPPFTAVVTPPFWPYEENPR